MNALGVGKRKGRSARKRAVSTIIATILLVAVTVVLAAVLYVLIGGLVGGGGVAQKPIGSAFDASRPTAGTCAAGSNQALGATSITGGCKAGDFIYTLTVESSTVLLSSILFKVETVSGFVFVGGGSSSSFALLDPAGNVAAISVTGATMAMSATWQGYGLNTTAPTYSSATPLTDRLTIVIDMGSSTPTTSQGLMFVALGTGAYSGATSPVTLP